jgi:flagella basal body P-ring formation protein FlgA
MRQFLRFICFSLCYLAEVEIDVEAEPFTKIQLEKSIGAEIRQKVNFNDFESTINTWETSWAKTDDKPLIVTELTITPDQKGFDATVMWGDAPTKIKGKIQKFTTLPVLAATVSDKDIIQESHLSYVRFPDTQVNMGIALKKEDIIGKSLRKGRALKIEEPLRLTDFERPIVVHKGDRVNLSYVDPSFEVTTIATARNNGSVGDKIIFEVGSKKTVQATVTREGQAEIRANL